MATRSYDYIADITAEKEGWSILATVVRLWTVPDRNRLTFPVSMELVLADEKGDRIQASVRRSLIYKFQNELKEGSVYSVSTFTVDLNEGNYRTSRHQYKLNFLYATKVLLQLDSSLSFKTYSFVPLPDIFHKDYDTDYLVDVMGQMTVAGREREYERGGKRIKMNVIELEIDGHKMECALFGEYAEELKSFMDSGDDGNPVVFVLFAKVKTFKGNIVLQNALYCTKLIFNPDCSEAIQFRKRLCENNDSPSQGLHQMADSSRINIEDDFLVFTPRMTIKQLKGCKKDLTCVVLATVTHVDGDDWWYSACTCNKAVCSEFNLFFCGNCNRHIENVIPRYRIKLEVTDDTARTTFVLFDRDACFLLNQTCAQMIESIDKNVGPYVIPSKIASLVEKTFLFKVEFKCVVNTRFAKSFSVRKVCNDPDIMQKFKDLAAKNADAVTTLGCLGEDKSNANVVQDCGSDDFTGKDQIDLSKDSDDLAHPKRKSAEGDINQCDGASTKILKRNIKIRKSAKGDIDQCDGASTKILKRNIKIEKD